MINNNVNAYDPLETKVPQLNFHQHVMPAIEKHQNTLDVEGTKWKFKFDPPNFNEFEKVASLELTSSFPLNNQNNTLSVTYNVKTFIPVSNPVSNAEIILILTPEEQLVDKIKRIRRPY